MKCIKKKTTGEIKRVTDEVAQQMEKMGWCYVPKSEWKEAFRPQLKTQIDLAEPVLTEEGKPRRNREKKNKR
jgi:hypothetical protein